MPIGIRPTNDFAFKKTFGSPENRRALISLLNAILDLPRPVVDVTLQNPFTEQDFIDDKLSILDIKAVDQSGAVYNVEMQLTLVSGLIKRVVFYGCEIYSGQLKAGDDYSQLKPAFSICILDGILWKDSVKVHHAFRFTDRETGRILEETIEIHTLELGCYDLCESDLKSVSLLECWIFWLLHAHEYEPEDLLRLLPDEAIREATRAITRISEITEDKSMYDSREKAIRDHQWAINASRNEGIVEGEIKGKLEGKLEGKIEGKLEGKIIGEMKLIRTLREILELPDENESLLSGKTLEELETITAALQEQIRTRRKQ